MIHLGDKPFQDPKGFRARFKGVSGIACSGTTTNIDHKLTEERYINGVEIILECHNFGDSIDFQVVDECYMFAGCLYPNTPTEAGIPCVCCLTWAQVMPCGVVLDEFGSDWYVADDVKIQPTVTVPYPARVQTDMTIRTVYTSTGSNNVNIKLNLYLHWKSE